MRKLIYIILLLGGVLPSFFSCGPQYSNSVLVDEDERADFYVFPNLCFGVDVC